MKKETPKKKTKCGSCLQGGVYCPPKVKVDSDKCKKLRSECKELKLIFRDYECMSIKHDKLLKNIKDNISGLRKLLKEANNRWIYEDHIYRFYHQSFKVYEIQLTTENIVAKLKAIAPKGVLINSWFEEIFNEGTGIKFTVKHNQNWLKHTRPMIEAFFHARFFLEVAVKYGKELKEAPDEELPSGWAALLYFYNLR